MSTHDYDIANQDAASFRADLNFALQAIVTQNRTDTGTAPSATFESMKWYDQSTNIMKMRNDADSAFLNLFYLDQTSGLSILDDTKVVNTSGTQTGTIGDQASANWTGGTVTTETLVSPAKVKAAVDAYAPIAGSSRSFVSAEQTLTAGQLYTLAHGLGEVPKLIDARMICKTAHDIFSVGDELQNFVYINGSDEGGVVVWADATNVYCRQNSDNSIAYYNAAGSLARTSSAQTANFKLIVRAWV